MLTAQASKECFCVTCRKFTPERPLSTARPKVLDYEGSAKILHFINYRTNNTMTHSPVLHGYGVCLSDAFIRTEESKTSEGLLCI
jgi:hypothetical protein